MKTRWGAEILGETDYNNPFYSNHIFSKKDLSRMKCSQWDCPILFFIPMKVQITEDGVFYYKTWRNRYYLFRHDTSHNPTGTKGEE